MHPVVLGLDTSGASCSAALVVGTDVAARRLDVGHAHSEHLLGMVRDVLADASSTLDRCDAVAFSAGPGSFTGVRVACAVAQGLAFGAGRPIAVVGTLDAIARSVTAVGEESPRSILVVQDARMGEVYWGVFDSGGGRLTVRAGPALARPAELAERLAGLARHGDLPARLEVGAGNGWALHGAALDGLVPRIVHRDAADAVDVAWLGVQAVADGSLVSPERAGPIYVRDDVARTTAERAAAASSRQGAAAAAGPSASQRAAPSR